MPHPFAQSLGRVVRHRRLSAGRTQDELAETIRSLGLDWSASSVAAFETGRRGVSALELLVLPLALRQIDAEGFEVHELVSDLPDFTVEGGRLLTSDALAEVARGRAGELPARVLTDLPEWAEEDRRAQRRQSFAPYLWPEADEETLDQVERDASGAAEQKAARRWGVEADFVSLFAHRLWGRSLTAEREARVEQQAPEGTSKRSLQALRGHVTRDLLGQLEELVEAHKEV